MFKGALDETDLENQGNKILPQIRKHPYKILKKLAKHYGVGYIRIWLPGP